MMTGAAGVFLGGTRERGGCLLRRGSTGPARGPGFGMQVQLLLSGRVWNLLRTCTGQATPVSPQSDGRGDGLLLLCEITRAVSGSDASETHGDRRPSHGPPSVSGNDVLASGDPNRRPHTAARAAFSRDRFKDGISKRVSFRWLPSAVGIQAVPASPPLHPPAVRLCPARADTSPGRRCALCAGPCFPVLPRPDASAALGSHPQRHQHGQASLSPHGGILSHQQVFFSL